MGSIKRQARQDSQLFRRQQRSESDPDFWVAFVTRDTHRRDYPVWKRFCFGRERWMLRRTPLNDDEAFAFRFAVLAEIVLVVVLRRCRIFVRRDRVGFDEGFLRRDLIFGGP